MVEPAVVDDVLGGVLGSIDAEAVVDASAAPAERVVPVGPQGHVLSRHLLMQGQVA